MAARLYDPLLGEYALEGAEPDTQPFYADLCQSKVISECPVHAFLSFFGFLTNERFTRPSKARRSAGGTRLQRSTAGQNKVVCPGIARETSRRRRAYYHDKSIPHAEASLGGGRQTISSSLNTAGQAEASPVDGRCAQACLPSNSHTRSVIDVTGQPPAYTSKPGLGQESCPTSERHAHGRFGVGTAGVGRGSVTKQR